VARDAHVDHPARPEFDEEEGEARPEPAVDDREEIVGPGLVGVVVQEGGPGLPACWGPLGGAARMCRWTVQLAHADAQLAELPVDPLGTPAPVLRRQALDRRDHLRRHVRALGRGGLGAPDEAEALPMPAQQRLGCTMRSAARQLRTRRARRTRLSRSARVSTGRLTWRLRTTSCWRRKAFSATSAALVLVRSPAMLPMRGPVAGLVPARR